MRINFGRTVCLLVALAVATAAGCGGGSPFSVAPVRGKITYADGTPIQAAQVRISFVPQDAAPAGNAHPSPAEGVLEPDGTFASLTTYRPGDGAMVGAHKVTVAALDEHEQLLAGFPARYADPAKTPLSVTVERSGNDFQLTVEKGP